MARWAALAAEPGSDGPTLRELNAEAANAGRLRLRALWEQRNLQQKAGQLWSKTSDTVPQELLDSK